MSTALAQPQAPFEEQARRVLHTLRETLRATMTLIEPDARTAADLARAAKLNRKLCWKIVRVVQAPDPLAAAAYVPGPENTRDLIHRVRQLRGESRTLDQLARASDAFEALIRSHAGDRATFEGMVRRWSDDSADRALLRWRRDAFRANAQVWGVQADARITTFAIRPSPLDPQRLDGLFLFCGVGIRRLRPTPVQLFQNVSRITDDDGVVRIGFRREPLDPRGAIGGHVALLRDFCEGDFSRVSARPTPGGHIHLDLPADAIGQRSSVTLVGGSHAESFAARWRDPHNQIGEMGTTIGIPYALMVHDFIIHKDTYPAGVEPHAALYGDLTGEGLYPLNQQRHNLILDGLTVERRGRGVGQCRLREFPPYSEALAFAFQRLGWPLEEFDVFRTRLEHPPALAKLATWFDLPPAP